jgi:uncharacterized membrane protein
MAVRSARVSILTRGQLALRVGVLVLSFLGYLDALYLTLAHYRSVVPNCSVTHGCEEVLTSRFSSVLGIPTAALGVTFYLVAFYLSVATITNPASRSSLVLKLVACLGLVASVFLFVTQAVVIEAYCQYCIASAIAAIGIFILSLCMRAPSDPTLTWW